MEPAAQPAAMAENKEGKIFELMSTEPLKVTCHGGPRNLDELRTLLEKDPSLANARNDKGESILLVATRLRGKTPFVRALIDNGARIDATVMAQSMEHYKKFLNDRPTSSGDRAVPRVPSPPAPPPQNAELVENSAVRGRGATLQDNEAAQETVGGGGGEAVGGGELTGNLDGAEAAGGGGGGEAVDGTAGGAAAGDEAAVEAEQLTEGELVNDKNFKCSGCGKKSKEFPNGRCANGCAKRQRLPATEGVDPPPEPEVPLEEEARTQTLPQFPPDPQFSGGVEGLVDWCLKLPTLVTDGTKNGHVYAAIVFEAIQQGIGATNVVHETAKTRDGGWDADIGKDDAGARMFALGSTQFPPTLCEFKFRTKGTIGDTIVKGAVGALTAWPEFQSGNSRVFVVSNRDFSKPAQDYAQFQNDRLFSRTFDVELVNHDRLKNWIIKSCNNNIGTAFKLQTKVKDRLVKEKYFRAPALA